MADSRPEHAIFRALLLRAALAGFTLGTTLLTGATVVLSAASGLVAGATGVVAAAGAAFVVGLWAGAPAADQNEPPLRERWLGLGAALAAAGAVATVLSLFQPVASSAPGRAVTLFMIVALPAYGVALVLPPLLEWAELRVDQLLDEEDGVAPWQVPGLMAGGIVAGAVIGVMLAGLVLLPRYHAGNILLVVSFVPLIARGLPEPAGVAVQTTTLYQGASPFGTLRVDEVVYPRERQPERRLFLNDEEESGELVRSGAPVLAYVSAAERWLAETAPRGSAYLFLGGGAYTLPRRVAERDTTAAVTVVELDPEVTRVAYRFFGLRPELGIRSIHGDARTFIDHAAGKWDSIYVDVYSGQEALPFSLVTVEAFTRMRALLSARGMVALNVIGAVHGDEAPRLWSLVRTFAEVFPRVALYTHHGADFPDRQNFLLVGALDPERDLPPRAGLFDLWPREDWPGWERTAVFRGLDSSGRTG